MRQQGVLKLGYFPLSPVEAKRIRGFLSFDVQGTNGLDPCAGTGTALRLITEADSVRRYGVELDTYRAADARQALDEVIQGSAFDVHAAVESFSLVYLNPPYDFEMGDGKNLRMERLFLEHVGRWVRPGGVLVMVIPNDRVYDCRTVLTPQFRDKAIYRLTEPESAKYKQVVVFGVRRTRQERERLNDHSVQQANIKLSDLTQHHDQIPPLPDIPDRIYTVPGSPPARIEHRGLPLDLVEDLLQTSPAWRQAQCVTHAPKSEFVGRPLTPLHKGHVGLLCTAGLLNGVFGEGKDLHVANWESVKVVDKTEESGEDGESTVIREKERFSQRLTLLYATGRIALLSEKAAAKEQGDAERTSANGQADLCAANA